MPPGDVPPLAYFLQMNMKFNTEQKYGQKQQIGEPSHSSCGLDSDIAIHLAHKVSECLTNFREQEELARWDYLEWRRRHQNDVGKMVVEMKAQFGSVMEAVENAGTFVTSVNAVADAMSSVNEVVGRLKRSMRMNSQDSLAESIVARVETVLFATVALMQCETLAQMAPIVLLYGKTWKPNESTFLGFKRLVDGIITHYSSLPQRQDEHMHAQSGWFTANWESLVKGPLGEGLSSLLCLLVMTGLMPDKVSNNFVGEFYKILPVNPAGKAKDNISVFRFLFATIDWVADCVIPALTTQDFSLLYNDEATIGLDKSYRITLDAIRRSAVGQMEYVESHYGLKSEQEILNYLEQTTMAHEGMLRNLAKKDPRYIEIQHRLIQLDKANSDFTASWHAKGLRTKPFGFYVRGPSSVGKSVLSTVVAHALCVANKFPEGQEYSCTLNGNDKFQSEFCSRHVYVLFDDVGNARPENTEGNPMALVIQFINNIHCSALSAEVEKKGKNDIRCKIVGVTSNTYDLHASYYSINPASIMRRFDLVIDVELKPEAVGETGGLHPKFAGDPQPDAWWLKLWLVEVIRSSDNKLADSWRLKPVYKDKVTVVELIDYLQTTSPKFFETQDRIVEASCDLHLREHCPIHPAFCVPCKKCMICVDDGFRPLSKQSGPESRVLPDLEIFFRGRNLEWIAEVPKVDENAESCALSPKGRLQEICSQPINDLVEMVRGIKEKIEKTPHVVLLGVVASVGLGGFALSKIFSKPTLMAEGAVISRIQAAAAAPRNFVERDDKYKKVYTNKLSFPKASVSTTIDSFEGKIDRNLYALHVQRIDEKSLVEIGDFKWVNAFPVGSCLWATVAHVFEQGACYKVKFQLTKHVGVKKVVVMINDANIFRFDGLDLCVLNVPQMGDNADLSKYVPSQGFEYPIGAQLFVYHNHYTQAFEAENPVECSSYKITTKLEGIRNVVVTGYGNFDLLVYTADNHSGMCGSLVVMAGRSPTIVAMHCAGTPSSRECGSTVLTKDLFDKARAHFGGVQVKESAPLPDSLLGKQLGVSGEVHYKSAIHYIESEDTNLQVFGQHGLALSKFRSDVIVSPMANHVKDVCGVEQEFFAPKKEAARPSMHRFLTNGSDYDEHKLVNPRYVAVALLDIKKKLEPFVERLAEYVHPLTYKDALNGVLGVKGFDPVNPLTSMGFPLNAPKHKFFEKCPLALELGLESVRFASKIQLDDGSVQFVYDLRFDHELVDVERQVEEMLKSWVDGERFNVIFRCNLKDEPVSMKKVEAKKIRVFAGAPIHFVIATRMVMLTSMMIQRNFPTVFENAVGVNAVGKDWLHIAQHLSKFGTEFCGDGDYSAFDQSINPAFAKAALDLRRWILQKSGFQEEMLSIFDGLATEVLYPIFEMDGLIFSAASLIASGTPITVDLNSDINVLLCRYCYYAANEVDRLDRIPLFSDVVSLMVYGDDVVFNVDKSTCDAVGVSFDMVVLSRELDCIGMQFTNGSKQMHTVPFKRLEDLTFLKRQFAVHPQLDAVIGCLEEKSIFKSLMLARKPKANQKESVAEICAGNLNNALREFFWHSFEAYDDFLPKAIEIAKLSVDAEGHKVSDYFTPVTKDELIECYNSTFSVYDTAIEKVFGPMSVQSGSSSMWDHVDRPRGFSDKSSCFRSFIRVFKVQEQLLENQAHTIDPRAYRDLARDLDKALFELKRAERQRIEYFASLRLAARAEYGFLVDTRGGDNHLNLDVLYFMDRAVLIDVSESVGVPENLRQLMSDYVEYVTETQHIDVKELEPSGYVPFISDTQVHDNRSVDIHYYGPSHAVRAVHLLGALSDFMTDPLNFEMSDGTRPFVENNDTSAVMTLRKMKSIYIALEAAFWLKKVFRSGSVEVYYGHWFGPKWYTNLQVSEIISRELDELEFHLGCRVLFPSFLALHRWVLNLEMTLRVEEGLDVVISEFDLPPASMA